MGGIEVANMIRMTDYVAGKARICKVFNEMGWPSIAYDKAYDDHAQNFNSSMGFMNAMNLARHLIPGMSAASW